MERIRVSTRLATMALALLLALLLGRHDAGAQEVPPPPGERLSAHVGMTPQQLQRLVVLTKEMEAPMRAILARQKAGVPIPEADRAELHRIGERHNAAVRALLRPDQQAKRDEWVRARRAQLAASSRARMEAARQARRTGTTGTATTPAGGKKP